MARPLLLRFHLGVDACWFAAADPLCSPLPAPCTLQAAALPPLPACSEQRHPGAPAPLQRHHLPPLPPPLPAPHRQHRPHPGAPLPLLLVLVLLAGCGRCLQDGGPVHSGICAGNTACLFVCPPPAALPPCLQVAPPIMLPQPGKHGQYRSGLGQKGARARPLLLLWLLLRSCLQS